MAKGKRRWATAGEGLGVLQPRIGVTHRLLVTGRVTLALHSTMSQRKLPGRPQPSSRPTSTIKRDSLAAELERGLSSYGHTLFYILTRAQIHNSRPPRGSNAHKHSIAPSLKPLSNANSPPQRPLASSSKPVSASATRPSNASKPIVGGLPNANKKNERKKSVSQRNARMKRCVSNIGATTLHRD